MGFGKTGSQGFRTESRRYDAGYGVVIDLVDRLPRKYEAAVFGDPNDNGLVLHGVVVSVHGPTVDDALAAVGSSVDVLLRPGDNRKVIFDDLEKTREDVRFLLEGVSQGVGSLEARWAHGAGVNRCVEAVEYVGAPHLAFENPVPSDGPKNGWLHLNLDGSDTEFDVRGIDGSYTEHALAFSDVVERLKVALEKNLKFRVSQRVLKPSLALLVDDQTALEQALEVFRNNGYTACVVRSYVPGDMDEKKVDVQFLSWPQDVPANAQYEAKTYPVPMLQETPRFVALRDGEAAAVMEVIPGYISSLVGNRDVEKSTKHKFASNIVRLGLSDGQKKMYGAQGYGPGMLLLAVQENGDVTGLTRLAIRTQGPQFRRVINIPSRNFPDADKLQIISEKEAAAA